MEEHPEMNFYYLNRENTWRGFSSVGLDLLDNGEVRLAALPGLSGQLPEGIQTLSVPQVPAGIAAGPCGSLYFTFPTGSRLGQLEPCQGQPQPAACLPGEGQLPGWLNHPRGLAYHPQRNALFVADGLNHRIQAFNPNSWQVVDIWGKSNEPGAAPWGLNDPRSLAVDSQGSLYVVDSGASVTKFDLLGRPQPGFWKNSQSSGGLLQPVAVAVGRMQGQERVFIIDVGACRAAAFDLEGGCLAVFGEGDLESPLAIAADGSSTDSAIFIGDNGPGQVLVFKPARPGQGPYGLCGTAAGYRGPIAALAVDADQRLWLHPGADYDHAAGAPDGFRPLLFETGAACAHSGVMWGGPLGTGRRSLRWNTLQASLSGLGEGSHAQFFVAGGDNPAGPPPAPDPTAAQPFNTPDWLALPLDADAGVIPGDPAGAQGGQMNLLPKTPYLWVGVHLISDGAASPRLSQALVRYDHVGYRQYLPALFSRDPNQADLLDRLLGLFESFYTEAEQDITGLDALFDPRAAPAAWLPWLAQWLALDLDESWPIAQQRDAIAQAIRRYRARGTPAGLREALHEFAGVEAVINEPIKAADWWTLTLAPGADADPSAPLLGMTARLAAALPDGAILGENAVMDSSSIAGVDDSGQALFGSSAHRFTVQVYRGQVRGDSDLERVRTVIDREKPAHTLYDLCVIEPAMRVGYQAVLGIDTVVAGPPAPTLLQENNPGLVLGGDPPGQVSERSQLGKSTRLDSISTP